MLLRALLPSFVASAWYLPSLPVFLSGKKKERHQEPDQLSHPEPQELGPLNKDTATTVQLCASEESKQHQKDITRILQQHEEEQKKWAQQVEKERELELRERLDQQRRVLEGKYKEALQVLQASHEQEKEAFTHSFQEAKAAFQDTIARLTSQLEVFQAKMKRVEESTLSQDYKKHIQDYGSPSLFWEQELESLHFVIEMKNERIHELDKQLILAETVVRGWGMQPPLKLLAFPLQSVQPRPQPGSYQFWLATNADHLRLICGSTSGSMSFRAFLGYSCAVIWATEGQKEKNLMLEEKITTLQQENEDLLVRAQKQAMMSRQLSEDLLLAQKTLEEESRVRRQLQQEKEELLYRVLGADATSTFPLASVTPTEVSFLAT